MEHPASSFEHRHELPAPDAGEPERPLEDAGPTRRERARERARALWARHVERHLARAMPTAEALAVAAIAMGVAFRILSAFTMDLRSDGNTYSAMGHALATEGAFLMPYGDVTTWARTGPQFSHHYPPLYPAYLASYYAVLGWGLWQTKLAAVVASLLVLPAVYWTTNDLMGRSKALVATGLVAAEPHLVWVTGTGFSENLVLVFFAFTMWGILKSLDDPRFIVVAGLAAGLAYLTRASVGYFFVIAGFGGFFWRFYYMRWKVFTNKHYLIAIAVFGAIFAAWATRNFLLFGWKTYVLGGLVVHLPNWETSSYVSWVSHHATRNWDLWSYALEKKAPLFLGYFAIWAVPFAPEMWRGVKRIKEESESALWLSLFLVFAIAWVITAMFWTYEKSDIYWWDNHRYVLIALVPVAWIVLRRSDERRGGFRFRYFALLVALLAVSAFFQYKPVQFADIRAAEALDPLLEPGDEIAVDGNTIKYAFYGYLTNPKDVTVYGWQEGTTETPDYIVSLKWRERYDGYDLLGTYRTHYYDGSVMTVKLWEREP